MREETAFSPAGISSFFEIRDKRPDGRSFKDPARVGARGGGVVTSRGIVTRIRLRPAAKSRVSVRINGRAAPEAKTSLSTISDLLRFALRKYEVMVEHRVHVPIGAGYGASAAGALSAALAFSEAADLGLSMNQLGTVVHLAEIANGTGLGTVGPLLTGGFVITKKSGGPGIAVIDRLSISPRVKVVTACFGPISTRRVLRSRSLREKVNALGNSTFRSIVRDPRPRTFMRASRAFAYGLGLMTARTGQLIELMERSGAVGATQNMLGQAAHAVAEEDIANTILRNVKKRFPEARPFTCDLDFTGARVL